MILFYFGGMVANCFSSRRGFLVCFFGGIFPATIAAAEAVSKVVGSVGGFKEVAFKEEM